MYANNQPDLWVKQKVKELIYETALNFLDSSATFGDFNSGHRH
jgi:hypothetical protein